MREIKFRAFENGQMYYQVQAGGFKDTAPTIYVERDNVMEWVNSTGEHPVMQFTGLKDKNGKEIYEGDILTGGILVIWIEKLASFGLQKFGWMHTHYFGEGVDADKIEVIGNKMENPELLAK